MSWPVFSLYSIFSIKYIEINSLGGRSTNFNEKTTNLFSVINNAPTNHHQNKGLPDVAISSSPLFSKSQPELDTIITSDEKRNSDKVFFLRSIQDLLYQRRRWIVHNCWRLLRCFQWIHSSSFEFNLQFSISKVNLALHQQPIIEKERDTIRQPTTTLYLLFLSIYGFFFFSYLFGNQTATLCFPTCETPFLIDQIFQVESKYENI